MNGIDLSSDEMDVGGRWFKSVVFGSIRTDIPLPTNLQYLIAVYAVTNGDLLMYEGYYCDKRTKCKLEEVRVSFDSYHLILHDRGDCAYYYAPLHGHENPLG